MTPTEQSIIDALAMVALTATVKKPTEFRVYYDVTTGRILDYTTDNLPGDYIIVDREVFHQHRFDWFIRDGKMTPPKNVIGKLRPSNDGTPCDPRDITVIVSDSESKIRWKVHTYED
jgi:hypothetical protein